MSKHLRVDITFDFICPWCYIAKAGFDQAVVQLRKELPAMTLRATWRGTRLLPHVPVEGTPFQAFYEKRLGGPEAVKLRRAQVVEAASDAGLLLRLDRISTMPNTSKAHSLYRYVADRADAAVGDALLEDVFSAYFVHGLDIGDEAVLLDLAQKHGLNSSGTRAVLAAASVLAHRDFVGVPVPHFVFEQIHTMVGARSKAAFLEKFHKIMGQDDHAAPPQA